MRVALGICMLAAAGASYAAPDPQSIEMGGGKLIPRLLVTQKYDDNIFNQATNEESDNITQLQPSVQWLQEKDSTSIALTYTGDYGVYWDSDDDDYNDHTVSFDASVRASDFVGIDFGASYGWLHDNRGEGSSEGVIALTRPDPDEYEISSVDLNMDFGRETTMFGFVLMANQDDIEYQNNRNNTAFRDRDESSIAGRLYARISGGKTKLFVQASEKDISYDQDPLLGGKLDSDESGVSVGVEWEATAKTSGMIRVGEVDKEFDSAARGDDNLNIWEIELTWSPRTYSHLVLGSSKTPRESNGTGNYIEMRNTSLSWIHAWSDRLSSTMSVVDGTDEYFGDVREDDRQSYSVGFSYDWRRWATLGATYSYQERDSSNSTFDYDKNVFLINMDMSL